MAWLIFAVVSMVLAYALHTLVDYLNLRRAEAAKLPQEFDGILSIEKFETAQKYLAAQTRFGLVSSTVWLVLSVGFLLMGGYGWADSVSRSYGLAEIPTGLLFFLVLAILSTLVSLPFGWYSTFVLEEKFGFNRSSLKTFVTDQLKGWALGLLLGGAVLAGMFWFFLNVAGAWAWAWGFVTVLQILLLFLVPVVFMPMFNKFDPLADGELKNSIRDFASGVGFALQGIYTMDGSKRSTKANAFFVGFGAFRRIVLFDTLVQKHTVRELVAIFAHEVGHYKCGHIFKNMALSFLFTFVMFWGLSFLLTEEAIMLAFGMQPSVQATFVIAMLLYAPFSLFLGVFMSAISRKFEFEADAYAARTTKDPLALCEALKKLSSDNLSNLFPHPWKVFLEYSHPPVLDRVAALKKISG
jgi:STE24 endopeptidase